MADKPTSYPIWGTKNTTEAVEIDGQIVTFGSKLVPTAEWQDSGALYGENTPRQYINYTFDNINSWVEHLDARYAVGDIHLTISAEDVTAISARLGGSWVNRGTVTTGTVTSNVWEKAS